MKRPYLRMVAPGVARAIRATLLGRTKRVRNRPEEVRPLAGPTVSTKASPMLRETRCSACGLINEPSKQHLDWHAERFRETGNW